MQPFVIEHEFPYRHHLFGVLLFLMFCGVLAPVTLYVALADRGDLLIHGVIPIRGAAATGCRWFGCAVMMGLFLAFCRFTWIRITCPYQRIAFTADGLIMPRTRWCTEEEFVAFVTIETPTLILYPKLGASFPTCLKFTCPQGKFGIARQKLSQHDFDAIVALMEARFGRLPTTFAG